MFIGCYSSSSLSFKLSESVMITSFIYSSSKKPRTPTYSSVIVTEAILSFIHHLYISVGVLARCIPRVNICASLSSKVVFDKSRVHSSFQLSMTNPLSIDLMIALHRSLDPLLSSSNIYNYIYIYIYIYYFILRTLLDYLHIILSLYLMKSLLTAPFS